MLYKQVHNVLEQWCSFTYYQFWDFECYINKLLLFTFGGGGAIGSGLSNETRLVSFLSSTTGKTSPAFSWIVVLTLGLKRTLVPEFLQDLSAVLTLVRTRDQNPWAQICGRTQGMMAVGCCQCLRNFGKLIARTTYDSCWISSRNIHSFKYFLLPKGFISNRMSMRLKTF